MTQEELKAFVKEKFNLTEVEDSSKQSFATATLEDGTKITNDKDGEFADGDKVFVEVDGEKKPAPSGDHITESGMVITLDDESIITGMKRPDEAGEGSEGLAEEAPVEEEMSADAEEKFEEEVIIEEEKMEMPSLESIIEVIAEVVDEKMMEIKEKMGNMEEKMKDMEDKMSAFSSDSAVEETIPTKKFSKTNVLEHAPTKNKKRYEMALKQLTKKLN